jgi:hypothetical protein
VATWSVDALEINLPMFKFTGHPNLGGKQSGTFKVGDNSIRWCWAQGGGLATDIAPYNDGGATFDIRCPLLLAKQPDGSVPCAAHGVTQTLPGLTLTFHQMWQQLCEGSPNPIIETLEQVQKWQANCPSCSYTWTEI